MKKRTFKNKLISIIAAASMLIGTMPVFASSSYTISIDEPHKMDIKHGFNEAGEANCLVMQPSKTEVEADEKPYVQYSLYVEKAGEYTIQFKSSPIVDPSYTSPATVSLNGTAVVNFVEIEYIDINTRVYSREFNLKKGENVIRFTITGERANGGTTGVFGLFHLFYIKALPLVDGTVKDGSKLIVDASAVSSGTHSLTKVTEDTRCVSGSVSSVADLYNSDIHSTGVARTDGISLKYCVNAPADGTYNMVVHGSSQEEYWGGCKVVFGDTEYADVDFSASDLYLTVTGHCRVRKAQEVTLKKGENVFYVKSNLPGTKNTNYGFSLDRIEFTPVAVNDGSLKFDNNAGSTTGDVYYGGTAHQMFVNGTETFNLNVPAGEYNLYAAASCSVFTSYLGTLGFAVGDATMTDFTSSNVTQGTKYNDNGGDFKYNETLNLTGNETITFKTTAAAVSAASNNYTLFDYFELVPINPIFENVEIKVNETILAKGASTTAASNLYYDNGCIASDRLIDTVAYSSSDNSVVLVNNNGEILAENPGVATVTVTYTVGEETYTASENITVYGDDKIIPISVSYNAETKKATVKLSTVSDDTTSAAVILGGYELGADGKVSKFTDIFSANKEITRGRVSTIEHVIEGDNIRAFIWNSLDGMKPIRDDIKVK